MEKALIDFLEQNAEQFKNGYLKYRNDYFVFSKNGDDLVFSKIDYSLSELNFKVFAEERMAFLLKDWKGLFTIPTGECRLYYPEWG